MKTLINGKTSKNKVKSILWA